MYRLDFGKNVMIQKLITVWTSSDRNLPLKTSSNAFTSIRIG